MSKDDQLYCNNYNIKLNCIFLNIHSFGGLCTINSCIDLLIWSVGGWIKFDFLSSHIRMLISSPIGYRRAATPSASFVSHNTSILTIYVFRRCSGNQQTEIRCKGTDIAFQVKVRAPLNVRNKALRLQIVFSHYITLSVLLCITSALFGGTYLTFE